MTTSNIWMYWEDLPGRSRPPYLDLCLESIRRHAGGAEVHVLDRESVFGRLPDIDPGVWERLPNPMYRSDYARTRLVHGLGGLWLDFDVIAMSPLAEITGALDGGANGGELVGWGRDLEGRFYNNLFAGQAGGPILAEWIRQQDAVLAASSDWSRLPWGALGMDIMWPLAKRSTYTNIPSGRIAPVPWYSWRQMLSRVASPAGVLREDPITVMLWNSAMGPHLSGLNRSQVLSGRTLLSKLLRIAVGESTVALELDPWTRLHAFSDIRFSTGGRRVEHHARRLASSLHAGRRRPVPGRSLA